TPVTSNSALEASGRFKAVIRTKVGSPYVIAGMAEADLSGAQLVVGFEANGGVLLGSAATRDGRTLAALPTRDAMLPVLCALREVAAQGRPLAAIGAGFAFTAMAGHRLKDVPAERSGSFLQRLRESSFRTDVFAPLGGAADLDERDGVRVTTVPGEIVHFR